MMIPKNGREPIFDNHLQHFFKEIGTPLLDLAGKKFRSKDYFTGDGHWNEKGHAKAAKYLAPFCLNLLGKRETQEERF